MLFIDNKYTRWYCNIINTAKLRETTGYTETHHIQPRSLGGNNSKENLVRLTAREHFVCHLLLTKMVTGKSKAKMVHAAWSMSNQENPNQQRYAVNGHTYQHLREQRSILLSHEMSANNPMANPTHYETHKRAMLIRGKTIGTTGLTHTEETKSKMRAARARQVITEETKRKLSIIRTGTKQSAETIAKRAAKQVGRKRVPKPCPHCNKLVAEPGYTRWHNDNCKHADDVVD